MLIAGRVVQGVAGGVFPLAFGIVNDELPGEKRAVAIGLISAMFGIGGGIGLPLAGRHRRQRRHVAALLDRR